MVSVLADAGCALINPSGPPSLPSDPHKLRRHLHRLFSSDAPLRSSFLSGFSSYILSPLNLRMWLDFLVDSDAFAEKLLQVLSICPLHLKKEIIGSLPEIIGDQNNKAVVDSLEQMLQEDSAVIVPVLDSFSNLNLDDQLQEQVITIALSCIRTIDAEHMPYLLRFLLLSATPANARRIISHIRQQLKFVGASNTRIIQNSKLKGKSPVDTAEVSILDALRSCLRFKNILCQEILKELKCLETARDHKVIDIWLLMLIYMNGESLQKSVENIFKKKIIEGCIQDVLFDQCIRGNKELVQVLGTLVTHMGSGISFEVSSALEAMVLLASNLCCSGILDYLEGFSVENLHKVYEVFSLLALSAWSSKESFGSSIANELLMIVRKQIERLANQGSLGGIDALLGCPLHLPSFQIFSEQAWQTSTDKQKKIVCISLYYAANWIRELLNAFCTQVSGRFDSVSQATKEEIIVKLLKRLRNLVFLESLLNNCLKQYSLFLPDLYPHMEYSASSLSNQPSYIGNSEKKSRRMKASEFISQQKGQKWKDIKSINKFRCKWKIQAAHNCGFFEKACVRQAKKCQMRILLACTLGIA
ncbi:hypothetical protein LOK49_LG02G01757 [Camellia lanceoleosa]|uniref:Uncharacterized protein n=1 Tax=Camellia lanceoleosa TaxID=1840588 RepID=A0ACC0IQI9_9ERIC|nr:hypothetical protein LOK49_LG02G01757 [Camellia lanceoleosa]